MRIWRVRLKSKSEKEKKDQPLLYVVFCIIGHNSIQRQMRKRRLIIKGRRESCGDEKSANEREEKTNIREESEHLL